MLEECNKYLLLIIHSFFKPFFKDGSKHRSYMISKHVRLLQEISASVSGALAGLEACLVLRPHQADESLAFHRGQN